MGADRRPGITVLLVEDSRDAREILVTLLEMNGLRVVGAANAAEALAAGQEHATIHLLLTDVNLPDGSGGEVASALQRIHPAMRSLFVSGAAPPPLGAGQAFLRKPISIASVLRELDDLMRA
jgi:CheY-like chemotaxis protein